MTQEQAQANKNNIVAIIESIPLESWGIDSTYLVVYGYIQLKIQYKDFNIIIDYKYPENIFWNTQYNIKLVSTKGLYTDSCKMYINKYRWKYIRKVKKYMEEQEKLEQLKKEILIINSF